MDKLALTLKILITEQKITFLDNTCHICENCSIVRSTICLRTTSAAELFCSILPFPPCPMHRGITYLSVLSLLQGISRCFGITSPVGPVDQFISVSQESLYFANGFYSDFFHSSTSFPPRKKARPCA